MDFYNAIQDFEHMTETDPNKNDCSDWDIFHSPNKVFRMFSNVVVSDNTVRYSIQL
jgi:hypothetical protein